MIDYKQSVYNALSTISGISTYYELFADGEVAKPCITYMEYENADDECGDTLGYSTIQYMVKVWADKVADIQTHSLNVDEKMRALGFKRVSSQELTADGQICKLNLYEAIFRETYNDIADSSEEADTSDDE